MREAENVQRNIRRVRRDEKVQRKIRKAKGGGESARKDGQGQRKMENANISIYTIKISNQSPC
jgi:hypothetical protein